MSRRQASLGLVGAVALVVVVTFPWGDLVGHSHWTRVRWTPFLAGSSRFTDIAGNVLLCVPIGLACGVLWPRHPLVRAAALTCAVSIFVEWTQVYSHLRIPSMTDVVCNVGGASGAAVAMQRRFLRAKRNLLQ